MGLDNYREIHQEKTEKTGTSSHTDSAPGLRVLRPMRPSYSGFKAQIFIQTNYPPLFTLCHL